MMRVLVTGAGGGVGQAVIKALKSCDLRIEIVAGDIDLMSAGAYLADKALVIPRVEELDALDEFLQLVRDNKIDVLIPGSEFELEFLSVNRNAIEKETGAKVVVSPPMVVCLADDKWETVEFLRRQGFPHPPSFAPEDEEGAVAMARELGYPVVLKPRKGASSRNVFRITGEGDLRRRFDEVPRPILQREIRPMAGGAFSQEFTCSIFADAQGRRHGPITARRKLRNGDSWVVEVVPVPEFDDLLLGIAESLPVVGSLNVQLLRDTNGRPVPFELNARFSGTTAIRSHFGFNEPEMAIRSFVLGETLPTAKIRSGRCFRYIEELYVDDFSSG